MQPNADTREQQMALWAKRVEGYCREKRFFAITPDDISPLTHNPRIRRALKDEFIQFLFNYMRQTGIAEVDGPKILVFWKKLDVWGAQVLRWAENHGKIGGVETVVGLVSGDDTRREEFYGMPTAYMLAVLRGLEASGKASLFEVSNSIAVKFLR